MSGAGAVLALILVEWVTGWVAGAAWTQSWSVVRRGHFRVTGYVLVPLALAAVPAVRAAGEVGPASTSVVVLAGLTVLYLAAQWLESDLPGVVVGAAATAAGLVTLALLAPRLEDWLWPAAVVGLAGGALLLGGVTNGMMLGHWYLNQPGLKPWALARLTRATLIGVAVVLLWGMAAVARLAGASTEGAVLGLPGFGASFGVAFYAIWVVLVGFTGVVVWGARRCVQIKSIQSATGLYYVAILTAGVAEFLVRYLMVNPA